MRYPWWRKLLIIVPIAAGIGVFYFFTSRQKPPEQHQVAERSQSVRVVEATEFAIVPSVVGYGTVEPARVWHAIARVSGEIDYVNPDFTSGTILKKGTEIIRISPTDYELQIQQMTANIRAVDAKISELKATVENYDTSLVLEKDVLALKEKQFARKATLAKSGAVSKASAETEENSVLLQRQKIQDIDNALRLMPAQLVVQEEQRSVYMSQLASAKLNLERTRLALPFDARIATTNVEITQYVQTGTEIGTADGTDAAEIEVQFPQSILQSFFRSTLRDDEVRSIGTSTLVSYVERVNMHAAVRQLSTGDGVAWRGDIVRIGDTIDPKTRTVGVVIRVDNPYENVSAQQRPPLAKGTFVEVKLRSDPVLNSIVVPRSALTGSAIRIADEKSRLQSRDVQIAFIQGDIAILSKGLEAGDQVIVSDLLYATDGMLLKTTNDAALAQRIQHQAKGEEIEQ